MHGINAEGFITRYYVCGPFLSTPETGLRDKNQLAFEKKLRAEIASGADIAPESGVTPGSDAGEGKLWRLSQPGNDWFIDMSTFYHLLTRVEARAYTRLESARDEIIPAIVWTYTAADVWLNGEKVLENTPAVYKPIKKQEIKLSLKKGMNEIYVRMRTLGARDTRTLFALQLPVTDGISVNLPGDSKLDEIFAADEWIKKLRVENGVLISETEPEYDIRIAEFRPNVNTSSVGEGGARWESGKTYTLPADKRVFAVTCDLHGTKLTRRFELFERGKTVPKSTDTDYALRLARLTGAPADRQYPFPYVMKFTAGTATKEDLEKIYSFLEVINRREDCSDFYFNALFRLFRKCELPEDLKAKFRESALNYRYWMDEEGADGMCFWSENHALLFYSNQYIAGEMFPDDVFTRSGLTGREVRARGRERCRQWLADVSAHGFEEFASSNYAVITSCALLSIIDFGEEELKKPAAAVLDGLIRQMALHVFDGAVVAPQGRAYRAVLVPRQQASTALMNLCLPGMRDTATSWLCAFALSDYKIPDDIAEIAAKERDMLYNCGNAEIHVRKTADFMLTSCASPKALKSGWDRVPESAEFDNRWIRTLNERFHGTTLIRPGAYGYQQHLMYAALTSEAVSFVNHPGGTSDISQMRPGYWNGNGVMPAMVQKGDRLALVYNIPDAHPVNFTHVFFPECRFDETRAEEHYLFARAGSGYMAIWTSGSFEPFNDILTSCEYRVRGRSAAYIYTMCGASACGFDEFIDRVKRAPVSFDGTRLVSGDIDVVFRPENDDSQYV